MNVHTPQRLEGETQADYRARQAASRAAVNTMTKGPTQAPAINALDVSRFFLGHVGKQINPARKAAYKADSAKRKPAKKKAQHAHPLRDEHGAFTYTGTRQQGQKRRMWLAGVSAQRGY